MLILRGIFGVALQLVVFVTFLIVPAGLVANAWDWPRGWQFIGAYGVILLISTIIMALKFPDSLEARLKAPASAEQPKADKSRQPGFYWQLPSIWS